MEKFKVVVLPTDEASQIHKNTSTSNLVFTEEVKIPHNNIHQSQHLYIVDTEATIEVGDFGIYDSCGIPTFCQITSIKTGLYPYIIDCKQGTFGISIGQYTGKIIASTDASLGLLEIHDSFVITYCDNPNDGQAVKFNGNNYYWLGNKECEMLFHKAHKELKKLSQLK